MKQGCRVLSMYLIKGAIVHVEYGFCNIEEAVCYKDEIVTYAGIRKRNMKPFWLFDIKIN